MTVLYFSPCGRLRVVGWAGVVLGRLTVFAFSGGWFIRLASSQTAGVGAVMAGKLGELRRALFGVLVGVGLLKGRVFLVPPGGRLGCGGWRCWSVAGPGLPFRVCRMRLVPSRGCVWVGLVAVLWALGFRGSRAADSRSSASSRTVRWGMSPCLTGVFRSRCLAGYVPPVVGGPSGLRFRVSMILVCRGLWLGCRGCGGSVSLRDPSRGLLGSWLREVAPARFGPVVKCG